MSLVIMEINNEDVLAVSKSTYRTFYDQLNDIIDRRELQFDKELDFLISMLYTGTGGIGFDIADYLKNKNNAFLFAQLVKETIEEMQKKNEFTSEKYKASFLNFYDRLIKYAESLPAQ